MGVGRGLLVLDNLLSSTKYQQPTTYNHFYMFLFIETLFRKTTKKQLLLTRPFPKYLRGNASREIMPYGEHRARHGSHREHGEMGGGKGCGET